MPRITAVLHTLNDAVRLGRALETLCPCDDIVVIDHESQDDTRRIANEYGAKIIAAPREAAGARVNHGVGDGWVLCLDPRESLTEALAASLFEWKVGPAPSAGSCFAMLQREETSAGWVRHATPETRLVPAQWNRWNGEFPLVESPVPSLEGELLRFAFP